MIMHWTVPLSSSSFDRNKMSSNDSAATTISSVWKGYQIRKIFAIGNSIATWSDLDDKEKFFAEKIAKNTHNQDILLAWKFALDQADKRLAMDEIQGPLDPWVERYDGDYDYEYSTSDWYWNDGGGYCDW